MPKTTVTPCLRVKVDEDTVSGFNASLNVALKALEVPTFVALLAGTVEVTVGGAPVVKLHT